MKRKKEVKREMGILMEMVLMVLINWQSLMETEVSAAEEEMQEEQR